MFKKIFLLTLFCLPSVGIGSTLDSKFLDSLLDKQEYILFEKEILKEDTTVDDRVKYLQSKSFSGHNVVYWMLAEHFAQGVINQKFVVQDKTLISYIKRNFYTALILTEQDSFSCVDHRVRGLSRQMLSKYPSVLAFERKYNVNNLYEFEESEKLIKSFVQRPWPTWACGLYGQKDSENYGRVYNSGGIIEIRNTVVREMRERMR